MAGQFHTVATFGRGTSQVGKRWEGGESKALFKTGGHEIEAGFPTGRDLLAGSQAMGICVTLRQHLSGVLVNREHLTGAVLATLVLSSASRLAPPPVSFRLP